MNIINLYNKNLEPWDQEPDSKLFVYKGYVCCVLKHPRMKTLCGYIAIPKGHPLYDKDYDDIHINVHGGWTFSEHNSVVSPRLRIENKDLYWIGFDCAHSGDFIPSSTEFDLGFQFSLDEEIYRDGNYVDNQLKEAIDQIEREYGRWPV